jgi:hypothetical protein
MLQTLTEVPLGGDPAFPNRFDPRWGQKNAAAKNQVRDSSLEIVKEFFRDAHPTGQFSIAFTHRGHPYAIRTTSNAVRLIDQAGLNGFDVTGCARELGVRVVCGAILHLLR